MDEQTLVDRAVKAMENAYIPYSHFPVGAALLTKDGSIITGGNIENSSFGAAICAERSAVVRALAQGHRKFEALAVATALQEPASPCGLCRQFLAEFGDFKVILASSTSSNRLVTSTSELAPHAFTPTPKALDDFCRQKAHQAEARSREAEQPQKA